MNLRKIEALHWLTCPVCRPWARWRRQRFAAWVADEAHCRWASELVKRHNLRKSVD